MHPRSSSSSSEYDDLDALLDQLDAEDREREADEQQRRLYEEAPKIGGDDGIA